MRIGEISRAIPALPNARSDGGRENTVPPAVLIPSSSLYRTTAPSVNIRPNDFLTIDVFSSLASVPLIFEGRTSMIGGDVQPQGALPLVTNGAGTAQTIRTQMYDGQLVSFTCRIDPAFGTPVVTGQVFVRVSVTQGDIQNPGASFNTQVILAHYITSNAIIGFPFSPILESTEGTGFFTSGYLVNGTGNVVSNIAVPAGRRWKLYSAFVDLATDATVVNRTVAIGIIVGGATVYAAESPFLQPASKDYRYIFGGFNTTTVPSPAPNPALYVQFPTGNIGLIGGSTFSLTIKNGVVGDLTLLNLYVEEFLDV